MSTEFLSTSARIIPSEGGEDFQMALLQSLYLTQAPRAGPEQNENFKHSLLNSDDDAKSSIEHTQAAAGNKEVLKKIRSLLQVFISLLDDLARMTRILHDNLRTYLLAG